jgi:hypothetical protein
VPDRPVRAVLDTSAIVAYTHGSIHVGEVLSEVSDEQGVVALPLPCLIESVHAVADRARLKLLVTHPATEIVADEPSAWLALATTYDIVGRPDAASAAVAALDFHVEVLTRQPLLYAGLNEDLVIPIEG